MSQQDVLFEALNNFHLNIKLKIEVRKVFRHKSNFQQCKCSETQVYWKENKKAVL